LYMGELNKKHLKIKPELIIDSNVFS